MTNLFPVAGAVSTSWATHSEKGLFLDLGSHDCESAGSDGQVKHHAEPPKLRPARAPNIAGG